MKSSILTVKTTPRGGLGKDEAIDYVGSPAAFAMLVDRYGLRPFFERRTLVLYRIEAIDEAMRAAERDTAAAE